MRVRTISLEDVDSYHRRHLPLEETRAIDFESWHSEQYKLSGFGNPEQYELHHGFAWLRERHPIDLLFTLHGLRPKNPGPPIHQSSLQVRLKPGRAYRLQGLAYTVLKGQTISLEVNGMQGHPPQLFECPTPSPRQLEFRIPSETLHDDGVQVLTFRYAKADENGNALLFHWMTFEPEESTDRIAANKTEAPTERR
jgi:hypothetical protein